MNVRFLALVLLFCVALVAPGPALVSAAIPSPPKQGQTRLFCPMLLNNRLWTPAASMSEVRDRHVAVLLPSGEVLVTGGGAGGFSAPRSSAERYDPAAGAWSRAAAMITPRLAHGAVLLPSGKVLVAGGWNYQEQWTTKAELYDPVADRWSPAGDLSSPPLRPTLTLLPSGKVLMTGGSSPQLYDPETNEWSPTTPWQVGGWTATLLLTGKVLVAGNYLSRNAGLYDPATDSWSRAADMLETRDYPAAVLLPSGQVLLTGGLSSSSDDIRCLSSAELYNPVADRWSPAASARVPRCSPMAVLLASGEVLVAGGTTSVELYNPVTDSWTWAASMSASRSYGTLTLLPSGKVLAAGGEGWSGTLASSEVYDPASER